MKITLSDIINVAHKLPNPSQFEFYYARICTDSITIMRKEPTPTLHVKVIKFTSNRSCNDIRCWKEWTFEVL